MLTMLTYLSLTASKNPSAVIYSSVSYCTVLVSGTEVITYVPSIEEMPVTTFPDVISTAIVSPTSSSCSTSVVNVTVEFD